MSRKSQPNIASRRRRRKIAASAYLTLRRGQRHIPPVLRAILGLCFMLLGVFGFLPVLGFWMIPLGLALLASDIPPLSRWLRNKLHKVMYDNRK